MKVFSYILAHMAEGRQQEDRAGIHAENVMQFKPKHGGTEIMEK